MPLSEVVKYFGPSCEPPTLLNGPSQTAVCKAFTEIVGEGGRIYPASVTAAPGGLLCLAFDNRHPLILVVGMPADRFRGPIKACNGLKCVFAPTTAENISALRRLIPWLRPQTGGLKPSFGFGDRTGLATPGHLAALRECTAPGQVFPILAQQSIREMTRTQRTPHDVIDAATIGVWQSGYAGGFGADADHLKTTADVDATISAGFTFFTIDPSEHVDTGADGYDAVELAAKAQRVLDDKLFGDRDLQTEYLDRTFSVPRETEPPLTIVFDPLTFQRAVVKYARAVAHSLRVGKHIAQRAEELKQPFEIEISVDETPSPTTPAEHFFVARELKENGMPGMVSLAPRFIGEFEKGVDYKGNLATFEQSLSDHVAIAKAFGPYKISVHSGSDKFAIYAALGRITGGLFHVKTAGTSYLEALRVVVRHAPELFKEIVYFSRHRFPTDRASYHISAALDGVPAPDQLKNGDLERIYLDENGGRQILHVTFGSVLTARLAGGRHHFLPAVQQVLLDHADTHAEVLKKHLGRHLGLLLSSQNPIS